METGNPEVQILFDQERAANLGLSVRDIADRVVAKVRGELATRYTWRDRKIDVLVRSVDERATINCVYGGPTAFREAARALCRRPGPRPLWYFRRDRWPDATSRGER